MTWAQSIFKRIGFVKRKATTAKVPISPGFVKEIGFTFFQSIKRIVDTFDIPPDLIINLDQTPLPYCLVNQYTIAKKGSKQVAIAGSSDHRKITGTFSYYTIRKVSSHAVNLSRENKKVSPTVFVSRGV